MSADFATFFHRSVSMATNVANSYGFLTTGQRSTSGAAVASPGWASSIVSAMTAMIGGGQEFKCGRQLGGLALATKCLLRVEAV
jgi:hypothetical protein